MDRVDVFRDEFFISLLVDGRRRLITTHLLIHFAAANVMRSGIFSSNINQLIWFGFCFVGRRAGLRESSARE